MSRRATDWAWKTTARGVRLLVLLALADYADKDTAQCHPSLPQIGDKTGLGTSTIRRELRNLETDGLIKTDVSAGGRHARSDYTLMLGTQPERAGKELGATHSERLGKSSETQPERAGCGPETQPHRAETQPERAGNPTRAGGVVPTTSHTTSHQPCEGASVRDVGPPAALSDEPSVREVQQATRIVADTVGTQPRPTALALVQTVSGCLHDGIAERAIVGGLRRWRLNGRRAVSLADFIGEEVRRTPGSVERPGEIDVDAILGPDHWSPRTTAEVDQMPREQRQAWLKARRTEHANERLNQARSVLARRGSA